MLSSRVNQWIDKKEGSFLWKMAYKPCQVFFNEGFLIFLQRFMIVFGGYFFSCFKKSIRVKIFYIIKIVLFKIKRVYYYDPIIQKTLNFKKEIKQKKRKPGISGFMRAGNKKDFLSCVVGSVIDGLDELVIVYNDCNNETLEIINGYKNKYPLKIKVYHYAPKIYSQGSRESTKLKDYSPHSLINYYNFALVKTNFETAVRIDGDDFFISPFFNKVATNIRKYGIKEFLMFGGVNLLNEKGGTYINGNRPIIGGLIDTDRGFFPVSTSTFYIKIMMHEKFVCLLNFMDIGILFYHLENMKKDIGLGVHDLENNSDSCGHTVEKKSYSNPVLFEWDNFKESENLMQFVPRPLYRDIPTFNIKK